MPDFESYLAHLNKKRRYNIRRNYRLASDAGPEFERYRTVTDGERAMELHRKVNERYRSPTFPWMRWAMANANMVDAVWLAVDGTLGG